MRCDVSSNNTVVALCCESADVNAGIPLRAGHVYIALSRNEDDSNIVSGIWSDLHAALNDVSTPEVILPESRTERQDWVREGLHLPR